MDRTAFREMVEREGYTVGDIRTWKANSVSDRHSHEFDAKLMVLSGEVTITSGDDVATYRPGDIFAVARGTEHVEAVGPDEVSLLVGRK